MWLVSLCLTNANSCHDSKRIKASYLRWDRADLAAYCELTRVHLTQFFSDLIKAEQCEIGTDMIDALYNRVISGLGLQLSAESSVPRCHNKPFFNFGGIKNCLS